MTTVTAQAAVATEAHPQRRAAFAFLITGFLALLLGALLGPLQALFLQRVKRVAHVFPSRSRGCGRPVPALVARPGARATLPRG